MFRRREEIGGFGFAFTDRYGGASAPPYDSLNLGGGVADDPSSVRANRERVAAALALPPGRVLYMHQVHSARVAVVDGPWVGDPPEVDAMVTGAPGLGLAVLVADCTPVLLADPAQGVLGVAHAGRVGLAAGVVGATVEAMRDLGATRLVARVGPAICGRCYEVPRDLREEVAATVPEARSITRRGTPSLDVAAGVVAQLAALQVDVAEDGAWRESCTAEDSGLYSYRRDGVTGRSAGLVWSTG